jgi:methionyl-tRNA formyltransferase
VRIDWARPADTIYNLIRGCNPQPGATTTWRGQRLKIFDCQRELLPQTAASGEVTGITADGFWVAASVGAILIKRVQLQGQAKLKAAEFITASGLKIGDRLNT